jgi:transcriptional regulator with XRE-family HTH domain
MARMSLSQEIARCRELLQISQARMAQLMNMKTTRLSDLEKARSTPSDAEARRLSHLLQRIVKEFTWLARSAPGILSDPRLNALRSRGLAS